MFLQNCGVIDLAKTPWYDNAFYGVEETMIRLGMLLLVSLFFISNSWASMPYVISRPHYVKASSQSSSPFTRYWRRGSAPDLRFVDRGHSPLPTQRISLNRVISPYVGAIYIQGNVDLQILGGQGCNRLVLKAGYPDLKITGSNSTLSISNCKGVSYNPGPRPRIRLYLNHLKKIVVAGDSCINGCNLNTSCGLCIENCGCGMINLAGPVHLSRVTNTGSGIIFVPCVRSDHVEILATRCGVVRLRGVTNLLLVRAFQDSYVDTRFMCSGSAMVQSGDKALVTLKTSGSLQAFATGMSNVYYYTTPGDTYKHSMFSGNVFQMAGFCE